MALNKHQNEDPNVGLSPLIYNPIIIDGNIKESDLQDTLISQNWSGNVLTFSVVEKKELRVAIFNHCVGIADVLDKVDIQNAQENTGSMFTARFESCFDLYKSEHRIKSVRIFFSWL